MQLSTSEKAPSRQRRNHCAFATNVEGAEGLTLIKKLFRAALEIYFGVVPRYIY